MDPRRAVWEEHNLRHITQQHPERGITQKDVDDVLADPNRREEPDSVHASILAAGSNRNGERFVVAFVELDDGSAFPVHARRGRLGGRKSQ